jgi:hypothetical protein
VPLRHPGAVAYVEYEGAVPKTASISAAVDAGSVARSAATLGPPRALPDCPHVHLARVEDHILEWAKSGEILFF